MEKRYTNEDLESFVQGFVKVSNILRSYKPDYLLAPITGAVPFVDVLAVVDRKFDYNSVQYVPSTSKLDHLTDLMEDWYTNFISAKYIGDDIKIATIDEVVSGSSALRAFDSFKKGLDNVAKERTKETTGSMKDYEDTKRKMSKKISYTSLGIVEKNNSNKRLNKKYQKLVREKKIIEIPVNDIITMDYPPLCPLKLKFSHKNTENRAFYKPEIESFEISPEYIMFLQDVARVIGLDPSTISPVNLGRIGNFMGFLSEKYFISP